MTCKQNLQEINQIAYNPEIRERLQKIHEMLGAEVTDLASAGMNIGMRVVDNARKLREEISSLTSDLTIALMDIRGAEGSLNQEEKDDFENVRELTEQLGNLQFKINALIKKTVKYNEVASEVQEAGMDLATNIMDTQDKFRKVRADLNAYGVLSKDPDVATSYNSLSSK